MKKLEKKKVLSFTKENFPWIVFLVLLIICFFMSDNFFTAKNILNILSQNSYVMIVSLGVAFLMISGGMDLSIGYQMSMIAVVMAKLMLTTNIPVIGIVGIGFGMGILFGIVNWILCDAFDLILLIVSLGTLNILRGISYIYSESKNLYGFSDTFKKIGQGSICGISYPIIFMIICIAISHFILSKTYFGTHVYAVGGNSEAAYLSGINIRKTRALVAIIAGLFVALATIVLVARNGSAQSATGVGTEITALTCVILGGVSIEGGSGKLSGVVAGVLTISLLSNIMQLAGYDTYVQYVIKGIIFVAALAFDTFQRKSSLKA